MLTAATVLLAAIGLALAPLSLWACLFCFFLAYSVRKAAANEEDSFMAGLMMFAAIGAMVEIIAAISDGISGH